MFHSYRATGAAPPFPPKPHRTINADTKIKPMAMFSASVNNGGQHGQSSGKT